MSSGFPRSTMYSFDQSRKQFNKNYNDTFKWIMDMVEEIISDFFISVAA